MEFRDSIKNLRKQFIDVIKNHYGTSRLIIKMIIGKGIYQSLSDADLDFRTCMLHSLSDKHINKLYTRNMEKAIENLRVRGVACMYVAEDMDNIIHSNFETSERYIKLVNDLKAIKNSVKDLGSKSLKLANDTARQYGYAQQDLSKLDVSNNAK